jgi:hypothetical protein
MRKFPFLGNEGLDSDPADSGRYLASRPRADQLAIARAWIEGIDEPDLLDEILDLVARANRQDRYLRIRQTIREMLEHEKNPPPKKIAYEARRRLGMQENMAPLLMKITCLEIIRTRSQNPGADEKNESDDGQWQEDDPE